MPNLVNGDHVPPFDVGLGNGTLKHVSVVSPRFVPVLKFDPQDLAG